MRPGCIDLDLHGLRLLSGKADLQETVFSGSEHNWGCRRDIRHAGVVAAAIEGRLRNARFRPHSDLLALGRDNLQVELSTRRLGHLEFAWTLVGVHAEVGDPLPHPATVSLLFRGELESGDGSVRGIVHEPPSQGRSAVQCEVQAHISTGDCADHPQTTGVAGVAPVL